jgi:His/Glu/Gln/Arg/opine family amino acid ABC transporter permease subunit
MRWLTLDLITLLAKGLLVTVALTLITSVVALIIGVLVGWLRLAASPLARGLGATYVEIFRNVPALVSIIFWAYAFPNVFALNVRSGLFFNNWVVNSLGHFTGLSIPYYALAACLGLILNTSAYVAELFRAGVGTLPREHWEAARTLGASAVRAFWSMLVPHGLRAASPALTSRLVHNLKNTALASFVAVPELFQAMQTSITRSFHAVELLLLVSILYWLLAWSFALLLRYALPTPAQPSSPGGSNV